MVRDMETLSTLTLRLECEVDISVPRPVPIPRLSWFKDGELISSAVFGLTPQLNVSFLMANPHLMPGVFDIIPLQILIDGTVLLTTQFTNISLPDLGNLADTTLEQARELVVDSFLGNWTCFVSNSIGSSSVEYIVMEYGTH